LGFYNGRCDSVESFPRWAKETPNVEKYIERTSTLQQ